MAGDAAGLRIRGHARVHGHHGTTRDAICLGLLGKHFRAGPDGHDAERSLGVARPTAGASHVRVVTGGGVEVFPSGDALRAFSSSDGAIHARGQSQSSNKRLPPQLAPRSTPSPRNAGMPARICGPVKIQIRLLSCLSPEHTGGKIGTMPDFPQRPQARRVRVCCRAATSAAQRPEIVVRWHESRSCDKAL